MTDRQGAFISLEGLEGTGKSTNLAFVAEQLRAAGKAVRVTREPGGSPLAEAIRELLLDTEYTGMPPEAELQLMFAARADHLQRVIYPALEAGEWVLTDRFTDASYAYQGAGRGLDCDRIAWLEQWVQQGRQPDLTLMLDIEPALGLQRASQTGAPDRFEQESLDFFNRVRGEYHNRAEAEPGRCRLIDAGQPLAAVQAEIQGHLTKFVAGWESSNG